MATSPARRSFGAGYNVLGNKLGDLRRLPKEGQMHERSRKKSHLHTIIYEIDMLRHCAETLDEKKARSEKNGTDKARNEYNLCIEGFLLHLRNLLGFFTNRRDQATDLIINDLEQWAGRSVDQRECSDLIKCAKKVNRKYRVEDSSCYDQISKFLLHCTTLRHEVPKQWNLKEIFADIQPILEDFEKRFADVPARVTVVTRGGGSNSTESTRIIGKIWGV